MPNRAQRRRDAGLVWSPLINNLRDLARGAGGLRVLVSPFASVAGVEGLLEGNNVASDLKVVCRWSAADVASGIADLDVYPLLRDRGIKLYLHPGVHLKLYVFGNGTVFHSSANATGRGLGLTPDANIEVGAMSTLERSDWDHLYTLFDASVLVDDTIHERALEYQRAHCREGFEKLPKLVLAPSCDASHSITSLPVSPNPDVFAACHVAPDRVPPSQLALYSHDRFLFHVPPGLSKRECLEHLGQQFRKNAFVQDIVSLIKQAGAAPFGLVKAWLQKTCSDKPVPYRWELTKNTQVLYVWLAYFFDEISWDTPHYSMVIRWRTEETEMRGRPQRGRRRTRRRPLD